MKPIEKCSTDRCGLVIGYEMPDGSTLCWFHAEKQQLQQHAAWRRGYQAFLKESGTDLVAVSTKRDNYGVLGR